MFLMLPIDCLQAPTAAVLAASPKGAVAVAQPADAQAALERSWSGGSSVSSLDTEAMHFLNDTWSPSGTASRNSSPVFL